MFIVFTFMACNGLLPLAAGYGLSLRCWRNTFPRQLFIRPISPISPFKYSNPAGLVASDGLPRVSNEVPYAVGCTMCFGIHFPNPFWFLLDGMVAQEEKSGHGGPGRGSSSQGSIGRVILMVCFGQLEVRFMQQLMILETVSAFHFLWLFCGRSKFSSWSA